MGAGPGTRQGIRRKLIQSATALLCNGNLKGFFTGNLYKGSLKNVCVPGLNCYSCPGALGACPIGSLQAVAGNARFVVSLYVLGFLGLIGLFLGRLVCGFLCPFGLLQELLYKIPVKKLPKNKLTRPVTGIKYAVLALVGVPAVMTLAGAVSVPLFCKYLCPAGTLEAGIPMVLLNKALQGAVGGLFAWKIAVLVIVLLWAVVRYRPFCRVLCPLGAIYSLFNKISIVHIAAEDAACVECGACFAACKMDASGCDDRECIRCGACVTACPQNALRWTWGRRAGSQKDNVVKGRCSEKEGSGNAAVSADGAAPGRQ